MDIKQRKSQLEEEIKKLVLDFCNDTGIADVKVETTTDSYPGDQGASILTSVRTKVYLKL